MYFIQKPGSENMKESILKEFRKIPGIGKAMAEDLWDLGFRSVKDLANRNPEEMYFRLCAREGVGIDRCVLYVFRSAVYFASNKNHDPELLKWWNWKDKK